MSAWPCLVLLPCNCGRLRGTLEVFIISHYVPPPADPVYFATSHFVPPLPPQIPYIKCDIPILILFRALGAVVRAAITHIAHMSLMWTCKCAQCMPLTRVAKQKNACFCLFSSQHMSTMSRALRCVPRSTFCVLLKQCWHWTEQCALSWTCLCMKSVPLCSWARCMFCTFYTTLPPPAD